MKRLEGVGGRRLVVNTDPPSGPAWHSHTRKYTATGGSGGVKPDYRDLLVGQRLPSNTQLALKIARFIKYNRTSTPIPRKELTGFWMKLWSSPISTYALYKRKEDKSGDKHVIIF